MWIIPHIKNDIISISAKHECVVYPSCKVESDCVIYGLNCLHEKWHIYPWEKEEVKEENQDNQRYAQNRQKYPKKGYDGQMLRIADVIRAKHLSHLYLNI